jgi:hypothetical protein
MAKQETSLSRQNLCPLDINSLMTDLTRASDRHQLSREELLERIKDYFTSISTTEVDEQTGRVITRWISPPTQTGLARSIGCHRSTLHDALTGYGSKGPTYQEPHALQKIRYEDLDILRSAVEVIEEYHEARLSTANSCLGSVYFLNNASRKYWGAEVPEHDEMPHKRVLSASELPTVEQLLSATDSKQE